MAMSASEKYPAVIASFVSVFRRVYSLLAVMILWEIAAFVINDALLLPRLSDVIVTLGAMLVHGPLLADAGISLVRVLGGFAVALLLGLPLGVLMGWFRRWDDFWGSLVSLSNPIPKIALVPLFLLWFGIGESAKIAVIAAGAFFPIVINTYNAVHGVKPIWVWRARTVGIGKLEILYKVILPAALPGIFTGARLGMSLAWVILIAAEMVAAQSGLGFRILYGQQMFQTDVVFAGLLSISAIGFAFDRLILWLSYRYCSWHFRLRAGDGGAV
jgi:ABC-type nitrate/sulfonate/bicarbonate transport system permease component